ncbi:MAG: alpha/beta hydrolase [Promethearchaeota archaeon]
MDINELKMLEKKLLISCRDGALLNAVLYSISNYNNEDSREKPPLIILCHGFTGDKYEWGRFPETARALNKNKFDALVFDFSGSGENERKPLLLSKQVEDLEDVYLWVKKQNYSQISIIGLSFGGLTALISNLPDIKVMVFWAPAFYMKNAFGGKKANLTNMIKNLKKNPIKMPTTDPNRPLIMDHRFVEEILKVEPEPYFQALTKPTLIIQGLKDPTIAPEYTQKAFSYFPKDEHHRLVEIPNATHDFKGKHLNEFINISIDWLKRYI